MNALEERARLYGELAYAQDSGHKAQSALVRAEAAAGALAAREGEVYGKHARGQATEDDLTAFKEERAQAAIDKADAIARVNGAGRAQQIIQGDLERLYASHLGEFLAEAEALTQEAREAVEAIREGYMEAVAAWNRAQAKWRPLLGAIRTDLTEQDQERGVYPPAERVARLASVPDCPLPDPAVVFGDVAARPRGVTPSGTVGEPVEEFVVDVSFAS